MKLVKNAENLTPDKNNSGGPPTLKRKLAAVTEPIGHLEEEPETSPESNLLIGAIVNTEFLAKLNCREIPRLLENKWAKILHRACCEYYQIYKKAPGATITELVGGLKSDLDETDYGLILHTIKAAQKRFIEGGAEFDFRFNLDSAEKYLQSRAIVLHREEEERLLKAGKVEEAGKLLEDFKLPTLAVDNDDPIFLTDLKTIEIPERQMIVHPFLKEAGVINIYGEKGRGKSLLIHSLAHAITSEAEFGPWPIHTNVPCAIVDGELDFEDLRDRFLDITPDLSTKHPIMVISNAQRVLASKPIINLSDPNMQGWLLAQFLKFNIKVVFFDNLSCLAPGIDENAKRDFDPINQFRLNLKHHGIANNLIHHLGKTEKQRGTSGRDDNVDTIMMLKKLPGWSADQGAVFNIEFEKARVKNDYLHLIRPMEARYMKDAVGENVWAFSADIMTEKRRKVDLGFVKLAECLKAGKSQEDMAQIFNKDQTAISRWLKTMFDAGHLDKTGKGGHTKYILNESGESLFNEYDKV